MIFLFLLAIIQGITEFLPISSSYHLIIFRDVFFSCKNIIDSNLELSFDIALHFGTLLAIIIYFYKDIFNIIVNGFRRNTNDNKLLRFLIVSTIPAAVVGMLFESFIENVIRTKYIFLSFFLILMGIIIYFVDIKMKEEKSFKSMNYLDSLIIGLSQVFALIPGFSRSGTTIACARLLKINRIDATKYSFYLSIPILLGAVFVKIIKNGYMFFLNNFLIFFGGIIISFIVGLFCIKLLLNYVKSNNFKIFMWYRIIMGMIVILYFIIH